LGRRRRGRAINGWLNIDKPQGLTSTQVVGRVRRLTEARKIGHGGTLDPLATGVLPVALGEATKAIPYVMDASKVYEFVIRWGVATDTDDAEGAVIETVAERPTPEQVAAVLPAFTGEIEQVPPAYSAVRVGGARAYDLARQGETVELKPRRVVIDQLQIVNDPSLEPDETALRMLCGKGTYVRSLARDLGRELGTLGHVTRLRRCRVGPFDEATAISLDKLEELVHSAPPEQTVLPVETALDDIPAVALTEGEASRLKQGQTVHVPQRREGMVRAMADDVLIAVCELMDGRLKPLRVFNL